MTDGRRQPQPGDLIEIERPLHHHWALYMGDGYVIHLTPVGKREVKQEGLEVPVFTRAVKKEVLEDVTGKNKWHVNNKSDQDHTPLPVEKILSSAAAYIGKEVTYRSFGSNCERFVKKLRYGDQWRAFVGGEMDICDMRHDEEYPVPGDLIEIKPEHYHHWALYMGDGYVIHVTPEDEGAPSLSGSSDTELIGKAKVKKELLKEVVENDAWAVNNKYDCRFTPLPVEEIIQCAEDCVGAEISYEEIENEYENFVPKLRYVDQGLSFVDGKMLTLEVRGDEEYPKPGDLIEIKEGHYNHLALYVGDGYVIHVAPVDEEAPSLSGSSDTELIGKAKVKKELLREVAGNKKWRVSNECGCHCTPLPVEEIIWHAEDCVGKELTRDVFKSKSVDFLSRLRHFGLLRAFEGGEIRRHDRINRKYFPIPGDLIKIKRPLYQHWALYMGRGYVIHVTDVDSTQGSFSSVSSSHGEAVVKKELLEEVVKNSWWWCVNNKYDKYRKPFPVEEILRRAEQISSQINSPVPYRLLDKNCEHFVTKLRYGEAFSDQVMRTLGSINVLATAGGVRALISLLSVPGAPIFAIAGAGLAGGLLCYASVSNIIEHYRICANFRRPGREILEQTCC